MHASQISEHEANMSQCIAAHNLALFQLQAVEYQNSIENYAYLWVDDRKEFLRQFLLYGHVLTAEEIEAAGEEGVAKTPPTVDQFEEQVDSYEKIYNEVEQFPVREK